MSQGKLLFSKRNINLGKKIECTKKLIEGLNMKLQIQQMKR